MNLKCNKIILLKKFKNFLKKSFKMIDIEESLITEKNEKEPQAFQIWQPKARRRGVIDALAVINSDEIKFAPIYLNFGQSISSKSFKISCVIDNNENTKFELEYNQIEKCTLTKVVKIGCQMDLDCGRHSITFQTENDFKKLHGLLYVYKKNDQIVVVDIDGTITKSDIRGHLALFISQILGSNIFINYWSQSHVVELLSKVQERGYKIVYLSSRPYILNKYTRYLIENLAPNGNHLPDGLLIVSHKSFLSAVYQELTNPQDFKAKRLNSLKSLGLTIVCGFGNTKRDEDAYKRVEIPHIFIVDKNGVLNKENCKSYKDLEYNLDLVSQFLV